MPIMSYLVHPASGRARELNAKLRRIPECDVFPAENRELVVLVTDTTSKEAEQQLQREINALDALHFLTLVSSFEEPLERPLSPNSPSEIPP